MELRITKNADKPHIILYRRDDGSETWMRADDYFVAHDLSHFAIEKMLGYKTAFMGMLNNGMDIKDFENRDKRKKITMTTEGGYAENMANIFLMEIMQGNLKNFNQTVKESFKAMNGGAGSPFLKQSEIDAVRAYLQKLIHEWRDLPTGKTMCLIYNF